MRGFFHEIWSMSGRYASYWNAFLLFIFLCVGSDQIWVMKIFKCKMTTNVFVASDAKNFVFNLDHNLILRNSRRIVQFSER